MIFLCNPENISERLKYTLDFIFSSIGFNIEITPKNKFKKSNELVIGYFHPEEIESFKNVNLINIVNFNELENLESFEKNIEIKKAGIEKIPILGNIFCADKGSGWTKSRKENYFYSYSSKTWQIEYDIISNIFYHISRFEERWKMSADEKEIDWTKSVLCRADHLHIPVVDVLLNEFKNIIYSKSKKEKLPVVRILAYPNAEKFAASFTHDVDITRGYSAKEYLKSKTKSVLFSILNRSEKKAEIENELENKNSTTWSFSQILDFFKKKNWKGTFFFISKMLEGSHIRYDIASGKFQNLFNTLKNNKHEIALHPSLKAFDNPGKYQVEKKYLEKNCGLQMQGMRQHYLRFTAPRLWNLAETAGLKYDSSLGYNFKAGFRAGTSQCFTAYDFKEDKQIDVLEFPITFFEYNLPNKGQDEIQSKEIIEKLIKQVEKYEGILNVLIHPSNFLISPFKDYWEFLIKKIEKKKIFVATLSEFTNWIKNRNKIILSYKNQRNKIIIEIKKPQSVKIFGLEISQKGNFEIDDSIKIKSLSADKYVIQSKKNKFFLTYKLN